MLSRCGTKLQKGDLGEHPVEQASTAIRPGSFTGGLALAYARPNAIVRSPVRRR